MLALEALLKSNMKYAKQKINEARLYPRNLGVGKPNDEDIDFRLEDWLDALIAQKIKKPEEKDEYLKKVAFSNRSDNSVHYLLQVLAFYRLGEKQHANDMMRKWLSAQNDPRVKDWGKTFYSTHKDKEYAFDYKMIAEIIESITSSEFIRLF